MAKRQRKSANERKDNLHKVANEIVKNMVQNHNLAKSINDASWSKLVNSCIYKAENAGKYIEFVNPMGTSQICSSCGVVIKKDLSVRLHRYRLDLI